MLATLYSSIIYNPLYNTLVFLIGAVPRHDVGIAVILLTVIVRVVVYPLSRRAIKTQQAMKKVAPEIEALRDKHKNDKEAETKAIFALYRERGIKPFSSVILVLIQLPILIGLSQIFAHGGLPHINVARLYSFVPAPSAVNVEFLGLISMSTRSILLAVLAGLTQFTYTRLSMGPRGIKTATEASFSDDMAKSFDLQARFMMPAMIAVLGYFFAAAAPLYWVTSNTFMIAQEYLSGRRFNEK